MKLDATARPPGKTMVLGQYRVCVCGSRDWQDGWLLKSTLHHLCSKRPAPDCSVVIVHGAARGADSMAAQFGELCCFDVEPYHADWNGNGKAAGPIRNLKMRDSGLDLVVAFVNKPLAESKGTAHMVGIARAAGVKTIVVEVV